MDLKVLDKSPAIAGVLVRLYDSHMQYNAAGAGSFESSQDLTRQIADIACMELPKKEQDIVTYVLMCVIRQAEKDLRAAISERLATIHNAPLSIVLQMANDEIDVARPVLQLSTVLSDIDLMYIIKGHGPDHWQVISRRADLKDAVINMLADMGDAGTAFALAENTMIKLTDHAFEALSDQVLTQEELGRPLLMRHDLPEKIARKLYACVGQELQHYIRDYYGINNTAILEAIDDIVLEFSSHHGAPSHKFTPSSGAIQAAGQMAMTGQLTIRNMLDTLHRGQYASFLAMFSRFSGQSLETVQDMFGDPQGKMLAVSCKALKIERNDLSRLYMMTQRLRTEDRIVNSADLIKCLSTYDKIDAAKARQALGIVTAS